jgi:hypothetical protein
MALDAKSGRIFLVTGEYSEVDPNAKDSRKRRASASVDACRATSPIARQPCGLARSVFHHRQRYI